MYGYVIGPLRILRCVNASRIESEHELAIRINNNIDRLSGRIDLYEEVAKAFVETILGQRTDEQTALERDRNIKYVESLHNATLIEFEEIEGMK